MGSYPNGRAASEASHAPVGQLFLLVGFFALATASGNGAATPADNNEVPTVLQIIPRPGRPVQSLTRIEVIFSEVVVGVEASDLLINGQPATGLLFGGLGDFVFEFPQPPTGAVEVAWVATHG